MATEPPADAATSPSDRCFDLRSMRAALALARRGLGTVWPNPAVGCVIVDRGRVVGRGWTQPGGRPHGETEALGRAGEAARGATAYVSLEPCCHWGRTPPCTDALIAAGIGRVVVALEDPDPRVAGDGVRRLRAAGLDVETGLCEAEAAEINAGFFCRLRNGRPLVTLKLATSLDGRIATGRGESQWITGPPARERAHALRAAHDAIMVGTGTVLADDPQLTCRLPGLAQPFAGARRRRPAFAHPAHDALDFRCPSSSDLGPDLAFGRPARRQAFLSRRCDGDRHRSRSRRQQQPRSRPRGARRARHHPAARRGWRASRGRFRARRSDRPAGVGTRTDADRRRRYSGNRRIRARNALGRRRASSACRRKRSEMTF